MICRILHLQSEQEWVKASQWLDGRFNPGDSVEGSVREILADVREKGDEALIDYTRRFDCPEFAAPLRVSEQDIAWAAASISPEHREQISEAAHNIRTFHKEQLEKSWFQTRPDGSILGQRVLPVDRVGLYVPGGQGGNTPLLSSMLMNAIPALVAGVPRVAVCTPPRKDGTINPHILAAAHLLDIDEIYRVGGAWSIGALAYGTQSIDPVDVIAGPGNIYVATAKRLVQGTVGIDMVAGPSEVLVVADSSARPHWLAADMLSQAEHDMLASAILLTDDITLAEQVQQELEKQCSQLPKAQIAGKSLMDWGAIVVVPSIMTAVAIANRVAPEHLELCVRDPWALLPYIRHAGAVFMGQHSPEPVGDYFAGPNHVLPTLRTARFSSALSVQNFCKRPASWPLLRPFCWKTRLPSLLWPVWKGWRPTPAPWRSAASAKDSTNRIKTMRITTKTEISTYPLLSRGKVRDIYDIDEKTLLIVTTDRMSAFDVIMDRPIPYKGVILNQITLFWMDKFKDIIPNHLVESDVDRFPAALAPWKDELEGRAVLVRKAKPLPVECIVRGYIAGSGWKDYQKTGTICGYQLPAGMRESDKLEPPLFTPSTKAELGQHDQNISPAEAPACWARTWPARSRRPPWPSMRPGGPMPPAAASSWPTPSSNSVSWTGSCASSTRC